MKEFTQKSGEERKISYYPSGKTCEELFEKEGKPADGWSRKVFFENGTTRIEECYSHEQLIEQIEYGEDGSIETHKIYSHGKKKLIDKPVAPPASRPNVVNGYGHMAFFLENL